VGFVANFIRYTAVENFENGLRFGRVTESLKVHGNVFKTV